jgi:hypothetical protein
MEFLDARSCCYRENGGGDGLEEVSCKERWSLSELKE